MSVLREIRIRNVPVDRLAAMSARLECWQASSIMAAFWIEYEPVAKRLGVLLAMTAGRGAWTEWMRRRAVPPGFDADRPGKLSSPWIQAA